MKSALFWAATILTLSICNWLIHQKQSVVEHGATMLLRLAPVDPRSLMQGDYMALRYEIARQIPADTSAHRGTAIMHFDERGVATFVRLDNAAPLAPGEHCLQFRRGRDVRLGAESFFFQEGQADSFSGAKYGELKVAPDGSSVLIGLRDEKLQPLGPPLAI